MKLAFLLFFMIYAIISSIAAHAGENTSLSINIQGRCVHNCVRPDNITKGN